MSKEIIVIGGGLAGLVSAFLLKKKGFNVILFEEKQYPFHRVCGEYVSNEVVPFLKNHDLYPDHLKPPTINNFKLTATNGNSLEMPLDLGAFGVSRYAYDAWLADKCKSIGVEIVRDRITNCQFQNSQFLVESRNSGRYSAPLVIGAFGKRSWLDKTLNRAFLNKRSPYIGVKYHVKTNLVGDDVIELHNFEGGYCGASQIERGIFNICYLSHRDNLKEAIDIQKMEQGVLFKNPSLKNLFTHSEFLFDKPIVINEITFEKKEPVYQHLLMVGDSAGMITPLCGNGMAIAIHSAKLVAELIEINWTQHLNRAKLEREYASIWNKSFSSRLWAGRNIQKLFGANDASGLAVRLGKSFPQFANFLMSKTHGQPF